MKNKFTYDELWKYGLLSIMVMKTHPVDRLSKTKSPCFGCECGFHVCFHIHVCIHVYIHICNRFNFYIYQCSEYCSNPPYHELEGKLFTFGESKFTSESILKSEIKSDSEIRNSESRINFEREKRIISAVFKDES
ncbi:hypothetical protein LOAG_14230 [Loa loa]|uniref:Uncharacterized protein n=1 Tax=Loa loa TaxID=7209 RepID=A0A1S0TI80_LOALO|nr:hypothetical protein LOAG_14230 [Loa loa]EFO14293.1 hypothetical protein LOAG_14230 [Loa loa]